MVHIYPFLKIFKINIIYSNAKVGSMKPCETKRGVKAISWLRGMGKGGGRRGEGVKENYGGSVTSNGFFSSKIWPTTSSFLNQCFDHFHMFVIPLKR